MPRPRTTLVTSLLVPVALLGAALGPAPAVAAPEAARHHAFGRSVSHGVAAPATTAASLIDVVVPLHQTAAARAAVQQLSRSRATTWQRRAQLRALAPSGAQARSVRGWAAAHGFTVISTTPWSVAVRGPAGRLATAFRTSLRSTQVEGKGFVRPRTAPLVPPALAGVADAPIGLDTRPVWKSHAVYGGGDVQVLNSTPVRGSTAGAGTTVATVNLAGWNAGDLTTYRKAAFGDGDVAPAVTPVVVSSAGHQAATVAEMDSGDNVEVTLDAETIAGVAPAAQQRMYFGGNSSADYILILQRMADDLTDLATNNDFQTASTSWGACELDVSDDELNLMSQAISTITTAGGTFFAASGDSGAFGCDYLGDGGAAVDFPAAAADAVAVGGTTVTGNAGSGYSSTAWGGSGGGCSTLVPRPARQNGLSPCLGRSVPDIATIADPSTGLWVYDKVDEWTPVGGTSVAAPASAAALATVMSDASLAALPAHPNAFLDKAYANAGAFDDVTVGNNGAYTTSSGYDLVTGLGSPRWTALEAAITGGPAPTPTGSNVPLLAVDPTQTGSPAPLTVDLGSSGSPPSIVPNGEVVTGYAVSAAGPFADCSTTTPGMPTSVSLPSAANAVYPVYLALQTSGPGGCVRVQRSLRLDSVAPAVGLPVATYVGTTAPAYRFSWPAAADSGSGVLLYGVWVTDMTTGADLAMFVTTGRAFPYPTSAPFKVTAGHAYRVEVDALDGAFNVGGRLLDLIAPYDDAKATLSKHLSSGRYVSDWTRAKSTPDYLGSHVYSSRKGAYYSFTFTAKSATLGVLKSAYGGYADVYVDGVKKTRLNLYSAGTLYRQQIRVASFASRGKHTVKVVVVGAHTTAAKSSVVYLDSLALGI